VTRWILGLLLPHFSPLPQVDLTAITYGQGGFVTVSATYQQNGSGPLTSAILTSADGLNWIQRQSVQAGDESGLYGIAYGQGLFVAVGGYYDPADPWDGAILTSSDGANWAQGNSQAEGSLNHVAYGSGQFVAVGGTIMASGIFKRMTIRPGRLPQTEFE
jgi:hypothetical protein